MKTMVVIVKVKDPAEFEKRVAALFELVASEPGNHGASWGPTGNPNEYVLIERYADDAAIAAHRASDHMKEHGPGFGAQFDGPPTIHLYEERRSL